MWNVREMVSVLFTPDFVEVHQEGGQVFWTDLGDYVGSSERSINVKERSTDHHRSPMYTVICNSYVVLCIHKVEMEYDV